jgi:ribosomal protein S12 methylthiotransferase
MKIGMISLGCPKNLVDSEVMLGLARQQGHELTRDAAAADVLVVNTCAFIDKAKQESVDAILEMAEHKKTGMCRQLIVTGCMAERYREELRAEIPEIDHLLGTGEVPEIVNLLPGIGSRASAPAASVIPLLRANGTPIDIGQPADAARPTPDTRPPDSRTPNATASSARTPDARTRNANAEPGTRNRERPIPSYLYDADTPRLLATPRHYAYVKIAEGCDYKCAFCIIPTLRGHYRSRSIESIVREAHTLAEQGVKEILLISQDTSFYGIDRGERGALPRLLRALNGVEGLEWIRMLYLYPTTIGDDVLAAMAESAKVCKYVDLPLQHASDAVLKRMKRPGSRAGYERLLDRIRARVPGVTLRTTFIVGFPGETDTDFDELQSFVRQIGFEHVGVFTYSHEEGTSAHSMEDDVPARIKQQRQRKLMSLQRRIVARRQRSQVGREVRLLVDGPASEHELVLRARLEGQAPDIDPCVYLTDCDPSELAAGEFIRGEIVGSRAYDLVARPSTDTKNQAVRADNDASRTVAASTSA